MPYQDVTHGLLIFSWKFSTDGKYNLGAAQGPWPWTFETPDLPQWSQRSLRPWSSTIRTNLRRVLLVHVPALGRLMLRGKRKSDYLAQVKFETFILEIKPCNLLLFSDQRYFKREVQELTKFTEVTWSPFLGPRKIVLITTCIECKKVE